MKPVILFFLLPVIVIVFMGGWYTWKAEHSENQARFIAGTTPKPALNGTYRGSILGRTGPWVGKQFDALHRTGKDLFRPGRIGSLTGDPPNARNPFTVSYSKGIRDQNLDVLSLHYNFPENSWWLQHTVDEIVQVAPGRYLGKHHIQIGLPFTLWYFELHQ